MLKLDNVSLVAVATKDVAETIKAIEYSAKSTLFNSIILFSNEEVIIDSDIYRYVKIDAFNNVEEWGRFVIYELHKYVETDYIVLIHADGFVVNPSSWSDEFLEYDYIGAPWPLPKDDYSYRDFFGDIVRVGNSVSLRSKKILEMPSKLGLKWEPLHGFLHEDGFLTVQYRHILLENGVKYPPLHIASQFSQEAPIPESSGITPFAFHKWQGKNARYPNFFQKKSIYFKLRSWVYKFLP